MEEKERIPTKVSKYKILARSRSFCWGRKGHLQDPNDLLQTIGALMESC